MERKIRVAINGFGRIGRLATRLLLADERIEVVAINDLADNHTLAHLFKYDSIHGAFKGEIRADDENLYLNHQIIDGIALSDPSQLPWAEHEVDIVIESTGLFRSQEKASQHIQAGAKRVIISAPASGEGVKTIVLGVNEEILTSSDRVISNASCTTNCLAPMAMVLDREFGIEQGFVTTVHAYTADQKLQDTPHKSDLRRARAAAQNIVPTSTNAGSALGLVIPHLKGKIHSTAMRVPVIDGSITELNCILQKEVTTETLNETFKQYAHTDLKGIMQYNTEEIVSTDIIGNSHSCIYDAPLTDSFGKFVKVTSWYDNEYGYSSRLKDMIIYWFRLG